MKTSFHSDFYICKCYFVRISMKYSPKCRTKKFGTIYTILGSFCSFLIRKGPVFSPKEGLGKSPIEMVLLSTHILCFGCETRKLKFNYTLLSRALIASALLFQNSENFVTSFENSVDPEQLVSEKF